MSSLSARLLSVASLALLTLATVSAQSTTWYWSYTEIPYYTWNSEWYECASGTITSSSATANFDGSYVATGITGNRYFYNTSGMWSNSITGISDYAIADNRFWPTGNSLGLPALSIDGLSYTVDSNAWSVYGAQGNKINLYFQGTTAGTGQIVEGDQPGGDVLTYFQISQTQSATTSCPTTTAAMPKVQTWSWMYTQNNADSSYVCASGHLTSWVGYTNGSYQVEDVQGIRYLYTPNNGQQATGITGVAQPYSNGGNTNLIYPGTGNNGASSVDAGGIAINLNVAPQFGAGRSTLSPSSTTLRIFGSGGQVSEGASGAISSSTFTVVPWSSTALQCNSSAQLATIASNYPTVTYNFIYTIQPFYTWDSEWSVCTTGTMTLFSRQNSSDASYNIMAMTGTRRYSKGTASPVFQTIVELIAPGNFEGNDNKIWLDASKNGGYNVDLAGISFNLDSTAQFTNGGALGAAVNFYQNGASPPTYYEYDANNAPLDTTGVFRIQAASAGSYSCPAADTSLKTAYITYTLPPQNGNNFGVCVVATLRYTTPTLDGGYTILDITGGSGTRYVYTTQGVASQGIGGVQQVNFNGYSNNNEFYTTGNALQGDGFIFNMYEPVQVAGNFSSAYSVGITYRNGQFIEYEPVTGATSATAPFIPGTFQQSATTAFTCPQTVAAFGNGITQATPNTNTMTTYFSYTLSPYYTWDSEWSVCASGTITSSAQQNGDYSYTATNVVGTRRFANNTGVYYRAITGASTYDGGDSYFWLTANQYNHPPVDLGGFSYQLDGVAQFATNPPALNTVNFFMMQSAWPNTPNWFQTPTLSLAEDTGPTGDVFSQAVFSLNQADTVDCSQGATGTRASPLPRTQIWQFYYTQAASSNSKYYTCASGQLTTWVQGATNAQGQAGYLVVDVEGFRVFYDSQYSLGNNYVFSTGLDGIYGPLEWATNDNFVYPAGSGTGSVLDKNGLLIVASPAAYFDGNIEANFVEIVSNGQNIYEYLDATTTPGTGITSNFQIWSYGDPNVKSCNTTNPPSPFPANIYFAFQYTVTPYYTWSGYWSVCTEGIMTVAGWSFSDYIGAVPNGTAYAVLGITGTRNYYADTSAGVIGQPQSLPITGLLQPYDDGPNTNMIYTTSNGLDAGGLTYLVNGIPQYENNAQGDSNRVTIYNRYTTPQLAVYELGSADSFGDNTEGSIQFQSVSSATSALPSALQCSSLTKPMRRNYAFMYTINSNTNGQNWQVCASGQMWTDFVAADGGQLVLETRGSRYFNYPYNAAYNPTFVQAFTGMAAPGTYGGNDNFIYPNGKNGAYLSTGGVLVNTGYGVTQFSTGPVPYNFVNMKGMSGSNGVTEFGGPTSGIQSAFTITAYNSAGQNPTCKAPYNPNVATQTLYFSYTLNFAGGSIGASGAITATNTANSDGSFTALWITGFRYFSYNGQTVNATITGLAPQQQNFNGGLVGDQKVFMGTTMVDSNGIFFMTDNVYDQLAGAANNGDGSAWIQLSSVNGQLTETDGQGTTSKGITSTSAVVSTNSAAVTQYGNQPVTYGAGSETASPQGTSDSSSSSSLSSGAIAGAVIGSVVGAAIICIVIALCITKGIFSGRKSGTKTEDSASGATGSSRFAPMEESRGGQSQMEMSSVEPQGETADE